MCGEAAEGGGAAVAAAAAAVVGVLPVEAVEQRGRGKEERGEVTQTNSTPVAGRSCGWVQ